MDEEQPEQSLTDSVIGQQRQRFERRAAGMAETAARETREKETRKDGNRGDELELQT